MNQIESKDLDVVAEQAGERELALQGAVEIPEEALDMVSGGQCDCVKTSGGDVFCN
jgi:hypothetical protein